MNFFKFKFQERELREMQEILRNVHKFVIQCDEELSESKFKQPDLQKHTRCYARIFDVIQNGNVYFGLPAQSDVAKARILSLNISYNMFRLLFLRMCQNLFIKSGLDPSVISKPLYDESMMILENYDKIGKSVNITRLSRVGPVKVCTRDTIFFRDFDDHCSPVTELVDLGIAGDILTNDATTIYETKYRISVVDEQNKNSKKSICDIEKISPNDSELEKSKKECKDARKRYVKKLKHKIEKYLENSVDLVTDSLSILYS